MNTLIENIERIQLGKERLKTSIENKNVIVPEGMLIDNYYSLVDQIQGGTGENWIITDCSYMFCKNARIDVFDNLLPHLSTQPIFINNMFEGTQSKPMNFEYIDRYLAIADFSQCTKVDNWCFYSKINDTVDKIINLNFPIITNGNYLFADIIITNPITVTVNVNTPNITSLSGGFQYVGINSNLVNFTAIIDLQGSTGNVTDFNYAFSGLSNGTINIRNVNMDRATRTSYILNISSGVKQFTFSGSFGGLSTTSSLTLDMTRCTSFTLEALTEMLESVSINESGRTRIFKLPSALYNILTDDIWDLADEKLYDIASE